MASLRKVALESDLELCANPASPLSGYVSPHASPWTEPSHTPRPPAPSHPLLCTLISRAGSLLLPQPLGPHPSPARTCDCPTQTNPGDESEAPEPTVLGSNGPPLPSLCPQPISRLVPGLAIRDQSWCLAGLHGCTGTFDPDSGLGGTVLPPGEAGARSATQWVPTRVFISVPLIASSSSTSSLPPPPLPPSLAKSRRREVWPVKKPGKGWG